ncbi:MAG: DUF4351 domain-containing protein, partial [Alphaproteobacteria bacterium]|nr:DUF4351 domain-containing protein [Alphaproteobacteria bacterium]
DCIVADGDLLETLRDFRYTLHDLRQIADHSLSSDGASRAGLAALKYVFVADVEVETLARIIRDLPDEGLFLRQVLEYLLEAYAVHTEKLRAAAFHAKSSEGESLMQTVGEQLRAEGKKAGVLQTTLRLLERRFGAVPSDVVGRAEQMSLEDLEACFDRALTADRLADVFQDQGRN